MRNLKTRTQKAYDSYEKALRFKVHCKGYRDKHFEAVTLGEAIQIGERWMCVNEDVNSYEITDAETGEKFYNIAEVPA